MRSPLTIIGALGLSFLAGCTTKSAEPPPLSGPSTLATSINVQAQPDSILQDSSTSSVTATVTGPDGRPVGNLDLRAEIFVDGTAIDFGTLTPKTLRTGSDGIARFTYTAPPRPVESVGTGTRVTIAITPVGSDFRAELRRQVDINVVPPGVILPPNGAPVPAFVVGPLPLNSRQALIFDASTTTDEGVVCGGLCTYAWSFGDGTSGTGVSTTHEYRATGSFLVTLTVTDARGTSATATQTLDIGSTAPPTASFTISPTPAAVFQDVFFSADASRAAPNRRIVNYGWNFGDGRTASGVSVARSFSVAGTYAVILTVTDDADATGTVTNSVVVGLPSTGAVASLVVSPTPVTIAAPAFFDASASTSASPITRYTFNYGDGTPEDSGPAPRQSHQFTTPGIYAVRLTITDSAGRTATTTLNVTVTNPGPSPAFSYLPASPDFSLADNVVFNASSTTGPSPIVTYSWNFGDGSPVDNSGAVVNHVFIGVAGTKVVTLTVTDSAGRVASVSQSVTVVP